MLVNNLTLLGITGLVIAGSGALVWWFLSGKVGAEIDLEDHGNEC